MRLWHLAALAAILAAAPLQAQEGTPVPGGGQQPQAGAFDELFELGPMMSIRNMRPSGMPIIPVFDGWIARDDGTADICFGYMNLNLEERRDVPLGENNSISPAQYDGLQPTYFYEVPPGWRRHYCVFTVNVARDAEPVRWTLRYNGFEYTTPGHAWNLHYLLEDTFAPTPRASPGGHIAPLIQFVTPTGTEHTGRAGAARATATARVGEPLTLTIRVTQPVVPAYTGNPKDFDIYWEKYSGPAGDVEFAESCANAISACSIALPSPDNLDPREVTTTATFSQPGEYVLLMQAMQGSFGSHCCWTNAYVDVTVR